MKYAKFEGIPIWQEARKFVVKIYQITKHKFNNDFGLINQIQRASLSVLLNISEGFERKKIKIFNLPFSVVQLNPSMHYEIVNKVTNVYYEG